MRVAILYIVAIDEAATRLDISGLDMFNHLEAREKAEGNYDAWMMMAACAGRREPPSEETKALILFCFRAQHACEKNKLGMVA
jgi:hypothetical protein